MKPKDYVMADYQVTANLYPARASIGNFTVDLSVASTGENVLAIIRKADGKLYLKLAASELKERATESQYPDMVAHVLKGLEYEQTTMFYEQHLGQTGLFAIARKKVDQSYWFFYTICPFARKGVVEGTSLNIASGLPLLITCKIIDSIKIKKLV